MRYPELLKKGATIGLVAASFGVSGTPYEERFEYTLKLFQDMGYNVVTAKHLRGIRHAKSSSGKIRAREFMQMYLDDSVDFIFSVAGGVAGFLVITGGLGKFFVEGRDGIPVR